MHARTLDYLNLLAAATPSYKASHDERLSHEAKWKQRFADWQLLTQEIATYRALSDSDNSAHNSESIEKMSKTFDEKRERLLAAEGYRTLPTRDDDSWRYPDIGHSYWNEYGQVAFRNMNANRGNPAAEHWFTDYYEEQP